MNDYKKFRNLTKPIKGRTVKKAAKFTSETLKEEFKELYLDALCKLGVLEKIENKDTTSKDCCTLKFESGIITTDFFLGEVVVKVIEHNLINDIYYKNKKGKIIPFHHSETPYLEFVGSLFKPSFKLGSSDHFVSPHKDIGECIGNKIGESFVKKLVEWYEPEIDRFLRDYKIFRYCYDISPVLNKRFLKTISDHSFSEISDVILAQTYQECLDYFRYYINNLNPNDLRVEEEV